jgi:hypothetical protein
LRAAAHRDRRRPRDPGRLPDETRYRFCRRLVFRNRRLFALASQLATVSLLDPAHPELDAKTPQFGLYDAYSPRYNHLHRRDEVAGWFREAGFRDITVLDTPPGAAVKVRGVRR